MTQLLIGLAISVLAGVGAGTCIYALGCAIPELVRPIANWIKKPTKPDNNKDGQ